MKNQGKKTFTKSPTQTKSKSTKRLEKKERDHDERDWIREEVLEYTSRKN
jgi:hypothetical protein